MSVNIVIKEPEFKNIWLIFSHAHGLGRVKLMTGDDGEPILDDDNNYKRNGQPSYAKMPYLIKRICEIEGMESSNITGYRQYAEKIDEMNEVVRRIEGRLKLEV